MKACLGLFLITAMFPLSIRTNAQTGVPDSFPLVPSGNIPDRPERPLVPASMPNPRFPLLVQIENGRWRYSGDHEYKGSGSVLLLGQSNQSLSYRYSCVNAFQTRGKTYQARWVKQGQKLEILMSKPGSSRTKSCRLSTQS